MIQIDFDRKTYVCPFCGHAQAYVHSYDFIANGDYRNATQIPKRFQESSFTFFTFKCNNTACQQIAVTAINRTNQKQIDIVPQVVIKTFPNYIPEQIRMDYKEANLILSRSPKAAATLLRRCLQGMIHDFWGVQEKNLNAEITALRDTIPATQWKAIDSLRKIGNIGAHMEKDVNLIVDIDVGEAQKLLKLIELLLEKWYIARHDEELLLSEITEIAEDKDAKRKEV